MESSLVRLLDLVVIKVQDVGQAAPWSIPYPPFGKRK